MTPHRRAVLVFLLAGASFPGCTRLYYASMEKLGREKRDILVKRIEEGRKDQEQAKQQFQTTLEAFQALTGFQGGDLEKTYKKLNGELEDAEGRAKDVRDQIKSIDQVANDMFREWEQEIGSMRDAGLKTRSRAMLRDSQRRHRQLMTKMQDAERRMGPVLRVFRDQVTFLKHNLNARAIASLKQTSMKMDGEVAALVKDIEASIQEADAFIAALNSSES
jgi:predicted  nucleic acid-binding Zn-ribbon protein